MRVIAGEFKSRKIDFPKTRKTRPVTDRMKETIFNLIGDFLPGACVLDLFAGSGSLGIESLSRGAEKIYFVEEMNESCKVIDKNIHSLHISKDKYQILRQSVFQAIPLIGKRKPQFNLVFVDPPYDKGLIKKVLRLLKRFDIVQKFGKIIIHRSPRETLPEDLSPFRMITEKAIGQAFVVILEHAGDPT